jgi:uncharacterized protein (TIRG00374 family)
MSSPKKKRWWSPVLRWGIAVVGIAYVLWIMPFNDRVRVLDARGELGHVRVWNDATDADPVFVVVDGATHVSRDELWTKPDRAKVVVPDPANPKEGKAYKLLAVRPVGAIPGPAAELLVEDPATQRTSKLDPAVLPPAARPPVISPLVERGINRMLREADWTYLALAIAVLPVIYLLTSYRWHVLLEAQGIRIGMGRTFVINMVGAFYNSFMPGSTGGDVVKAYYAAKNTPHKTRAVLTVIVDRIVGLLALLILGGVMAVVQFDVPECRRVAIAAAVICGATVVGLAVFYQPTLRRVTGLDWLLRRLPLQGQVTHAVAAMEIYGKRPVVMLWTLVCSFPVHIATICSATLAGQAFHLPLEATYYWVMVPVIALVGAIPISPQGAGVMEVTAIALTSRHGATAAQAAALVTSMRLTQIFWNLLAGVFVLRGGYHAPTEAEQHELDADAPSPDAPAAPATAGSPAAGDRPAPAV